MDLNKVYVSYCEFYNTSALYGNILRGSTNNDLLVENSKSVEMSGSAGVFVLMLRENRVFLNFKLFFEKINFFSYLLRLSL